MKLEVIAVKLVEIVQWDVVVELSVEANGCLISPAAGNVLYCIAATAKNKEGQSPRLNELHTISMASYCCVVSSQSVISK